MLLQTWDDRELLAIRKAIASLHAQSQITTEQQQRHIELLEKNSYCELTPVERQELSQLRLTHW
jgi:hypothetical protein